MMLLYQLPMNKTTFVFTTSSLLIWLQSTSRHRCVLQSSLQQQLWQPHTRLLLTCPFFISRFVFHPTAASLCAGWSTLNLHFAFSFLIVWTFRSVCALKKIIETSYKSLHRKSLTRNNKWGSVSLSSSVSHRVRHQHHIRCDSSLGLKKSFFAGNLLVY